MKPLSSVLHTSKVASEAAHHTILYIFYVR